MKKILIIITMMFAIISFSQKAITCVNTTYVYELSSTDMKALMNAEIELFNPRDIHMKIVFNINTIDIVSNNNLTHLIITESSVIDDMSIIACENEQGKYIVNIDNKTIWIFEGGDPIVLYKFNYKKL